MGLVRNETAADKIQRMKAIIEENGSLNLNQDPSSGSGYCRPGAEFVYAFRRTGIFADFRM